MSLPAVLYIKDLRRLLDGWGRRRIRHFLRANELALVDKSGLVYTTPQLIAERMPEAHAALQAKWSSAGATAEALDADDDFSDLYGEQS